MLSVNFHQGDIRKIAKELDVPISRIKRQITKVMRDEFRKEALQLRKLATSGPIFARSGKLAKSVPLRGHVTETSFTVDGTVGFTNFKDERTEIAAGTLVGDSGGSTIIEPSEAQKLAFPIPGSSPDFIIDPSTGEQLMSVRESQDFFHLIYADSAILGRPLDGTRELVFLFARRDQVEVPVKLDLSDESDELAERIETRIMEVIDPLEK